ncbi:hypothetical protein HHX47_DHR2001183 [Lentinula edodes]|nr:hypothetical protein HHX47_DHR2001183 [Lentinula edodes]
MCLHIKRSNTKWNRPCKQALSEHTTHSPRATSALNLTLPKLTYSSSGPWLPIAHNCISGIVYVPRATRVVLSGDDSEGDDTEVACVEYPFGRNSDKVLEASTSVKEKSCGFLLNGFR